MKNSTKSEFCIDENLNEFIQTWPRSMKNSFKDYYSNASWPKGMIFSLDYDYEKVPFWFILPNQMLSKFVRGDFGDEKNIKFLHDCLWAQYCIFMFIRIKDDVIDEDEKNALLILISDQFLFDAEETLHKYFERSNPFWKTYFQLLRETTQAMYEKEVFEKLNQQAATEIIELSGKEGAILNIGTAAVCSKYNKINEFKLLKKMTYHLVISRQIIDDLFDLEEDLKIGKFNYAASRLIKNNFTQFDGSNSAIKSLTESMINSDGINILLEDGNKSLGKAEAIAEQFGISFIQDLITGWCAALLW